MYSSNLKVGHLYLISASDAASIPSAAVLADSTVDCYGVKKLVASMGSYQHNPHSDGQLFVNGSPVTQMLKACR